MGNVIDITVFKNKKFHRDVEFLFKELGVKYEKRLKFIRENPEQFLDEMRPYIKAIYDIFYEMKLPNDTSVLMTSTVVETPFFTIPDTTINVPIEDYKRLRRLESKLYSIQKSLDRSETVGEEK